MTWCEVWKNQNQAKARVSANQAKHAFAHITKRKEKNKSLDHGLLLMLFFSCKRKNRTEITLCVFHLCNKKYICMYEKPRATLKLETKRHVVNSIKKVLCRADTWLEDNAAETRTAKKEEIERTEWEVFIVLLIWVFNEQRNCLFHWVLFS